MKKIVAIHQLHYLPWLRYFEKIAHSDSFIILDNVQFVKNEWHNRNKIKTNRGPQILSIPVCQQLGQNLHEVKIAAQQNWQKKQLQSIKQNYQKAAYFSDFITELEPFYHHDYEKLNSINKAMLTYFLKVLGIQTEILYASDFPPSTAKSSARLVELCQHVHATTYYCGRHAAEQYLDRELFEAANIAIEIQDWNCPPYRQLYTEKNNFTPDLAILDLLFNEGPRSLEIILHGAK